MSDCVHGYLAGLHCPTCNPSDKPDMELPTPYAMEPAAPHAMDIADTWSDSYSHGAAIFHLLSARALLSTRKEHLELAKQYIDREIGR